MSCAIECHAQNVGKCTPGAVLGRAKGVLRYLGMVTIVLNDYPPLKFLLIGEMCWAGGTGGGCFV